jgi:hypothetical protein
MQLPVTGGEKAPVSTVTHFHITRASVTLDSSATQDTEDAHNIVSFQVRITTIPSISDAELLTPG